jgi:hypothetical protein
MLPSRLQDDGSNTTPTNNWKPTAKDEMQIRQPDLRIVPRKKKTQNNRTGLEPTAKTLQAVPAALIGHSTPQCRKTET